jgi:hypothetical protein
MEEATSASHRTPAEFGQSPNTPFTCSFSGPYRNLETQCFRKNGSALGCIHPFNHEETCQRINSSSRISRSEQAQSRDGLEKGAHHLGRQWDRRGFVGGIDDQTATRVLRLLQQHFAIDGYWK